MTRPSSADLRLVPHLCPACELLNYWHAFIDWDAETVRMWADHPDDDEGEPEGYDQLRARRPSYGDNWATAVFEYDYRGLSDALPFLRCALHGEDA